MVGELYRIDSVHFKTNKNCLFEKRLNKKKLNKKQPTCPRTPSAYPV
jgi:hypothetical protein